MKRKKIWNWLWLIAMALPMMMACGGDDSGDNGSSGGNNSGGNGSGNGGGNTTTTFNIIGTWRAYYQRNGQQIYDLVTFNADHTGYIIEEVGNGTDYANPINWTQTGNVIKVTMDVNYVLVWTIQQIIDNNTAVVNDGKKDIMVYRDGTGEPYNNGNNNGNNNGDNNGGSTTNQTCPDNNHPHWIDLGLPSGTKWACCNEGAETPEDYGGYYAFGEIASAPNEDQIQELIHNATKSVFGAHSNESFAYGVDITGPNGKVIFFPAAGYSLNGGINQQLENGLYWSSSQADAENYYVFGLDSEEIYLSALPKAFQQSTLYLSVRPVQGGTNSGGGGETTPVDSTLYETPYLNWGASKSTVKADRSAAGYTLRSDFDTFITYEPKYREKNSRYSFDSEGKLERSSVQFESSTISFSALCDYVRNTLGAVYDSTSSDGTMWFNAKDGKSSIFVMTYTDGDVGVVYIKPFSLSPAFRGNRAKIVKMERQMEALSAKQALSAKKTSAKKKVSVNDAFNAKIVRRSHF